ncbi:cell division cycle-associated 7-like protein [Patiria miniata]|uniref:Zinc-finger domain-containing protein n=1 Tax=Patiria miniata TaxID=46514 RepID=A0A914AQ55_PATMI|nr:cell division cycle-associated 7-like protein [Patiria miniata]
MGRAVESETATDKCSWKRTPKMAPNPKLSEIDTEDDVSYELRRQKNIEENKAMLNQLLSDLHGMPGLPRRSNSTKRSPKTRKSLDCSFIRRRNPSRKARLSTPLFARPSIIRTRGQKRRAETGEEDEVKVYVDDDEDLFPVKEGEKLIIKFGPTLKKSSLGSGNDSDSDFEVYEDDEMEELPTPTKRRRLNNRPREAVKRPEDITEEELRMVAECVRDKKYNTEVGTSCHQCRQKTIDMKTICRDDGCTGVRGQFCGPCLRNRYGEDAKAALLNPDWICPPCRGICNCSFCRKKQGRHATGILIHLARGSGYSSVKDYLEKFSRA